MFIFQIVDYLWLLDGAVGKDRNRKSRKSDILSFVTCLMFKLKIWYNTET